MEVARDIQSTQNMKLLIFLQDSKKKMSQLLSCIILMQNFEIFHKDPVIFGVTC